MQEKISEIKIINRRIFVDIQKIPVIVYVRKGDEPLREATEPARITFTSA